VTGVQVTATFHGVAIKGAVKVGAVRGVNLATERLRGHSVEKAPIDLGDLRGSSTVLQATEQQHTPEATLVFDEPYAAIQHEREDFNHTAGAAGEPAGEARYVISNVEDSTRRAEYEGIIGKAVRDAIRDAS
jgi:hypothetical protein